MSTILAEAKSAVTPDLHALPTPPSRAVVERLARDAFAYFVEADEAWQEQNRIAHATWEARDEALRTFTGLAVALDTLTNEAQDDPPFTRDELDRTAEDGDVPFRKLWRMACR